MTLIELMVAIAGMLVVMFIVYELYDQTQSASLKMTKRQSAIDYSVQIIDKTTQLLAQAVSPENLENPGSVTPVFKNDQLTVPSYREDASAGLYRVTIRKAENEGESVYFVRNEAPVASATGQQPVKETTEPFGGKTKDFKPEISFRYALTAKPGAPVEYVNELPSGQWPALVEVAVAIKLEPTDPQGEVVEMRTSCIPGQIAKSEIAKAQPAPAPAQPQAPPSAAPGTQPAPATAPPTAPATAPALPPPSASAPPSARAARSAAI